LGLGQRREHRRERDPKKRWGGVDADFTNATVLPQAVPKWLVGLLQRGRNASQTGEKMKGEA
jgi:hypothetical protein